MSEFLAEARVLIRPDTTRFRPDLQEAVNRAVSQVRAVVPIQFVAGGSSAAAATASLVAAQTELAASTQVVTGLAQVENTTFAKQAVLLDAASAATQRKAGADATAAAAARGHAAAQASVSKGVIASLAGFTGLRGAVLSAGTGFLAGAVAVQALVKSLSLFAGFQKDLATFSVTTGATADQLERVGKAAREFAADATLPGVGIRDATQAMLELSKAGLDVNESISATRGVLQLATAAEIENAQAVDLVANALNVFQLNGDEATHVADLLANAANAAQGSIADMGIALRQSASVAAQLGLSVDETVGFITQLAKAGLAGSDAGTTLRVALSRLVAPTEKARDAIHELRLDLFDAQGDLNPDIFVQLGRALSDVAKQDRAAKLVDIFGENAQRVASILANQGFTAFKAVREELEKTGTAADVAGAKTAGLSGQANQAANEFERLGLSIGTVTAPIAGLGLSGLNASLGSLNTVLEKNIENFKDVKTSVGDASSAFADFIENNTAFGKFADDTADKAGFLSDKIGDLAHNITEFRRNVVGIQGDGEKAIPPIQGLTAAEIKLAEGLRDANLGLAEQIERLKNLAKEAEKPATAVQQRATDVAVAAASGDDNALLAALREQERAQQAFLDRVLSRPQSQKNQQLAEKAANNLAATRSRIAAIIESGATDARRAAKDAQDKLDEADRAILNLLDDRRQDQERRVARASDTAGLQDDIRAQNNLQALIQQQIRKIRDRVKDEQQRKDAIRELRIALIASRQEEERLREERKQQAAERASEILDIKIQIAETKGQVALEKRLLNEKIRRLKTQIAAAKGDRLLQEQLRLELAQTQKQLEDLKKQQDKNTTAANAFREATFRFLQTQQGFAANLLGNLIPGFATGGLVGGSTPTARGPSDIGAGPQDRINQAATVAGARDRGVRPVQVDRTNQLLQQIVHLLQGRHSKADPPEIVFNRGAGSTAFDTL